MKKKFEYKTNVLYNSDDEPAGYHITNSDGCIWDNGVGVAPDGTFCGECDKVRCETCEVREKYHLKGKVE